MKRYIIACACLLALIIAIGYAYLFHGWYLPLPQDPHREVEVVAKQEGKELLLGTDAGFSPFEIKGVDMGSGMPGHFATDYAIDKETYLRWFGQIKAMGANTIRVYTLLGTDFYEAFYEYNCENDDPLYLLHGVWIDDYTQNSHMDAFDSSYLDRFKDDIRTVVDVIHGQRFVQLGRVAGTGVYTKDISPWVLGYILGVEWEAPTVAYTDLMEPSRSSFEGAYLRTTAEATPFEAMLAEAGNEALRYETDRYGVQRLVAFSNWPTTDPFSYPEALEAFFSKYASVDVEHITATDAVESGMFASYHIYPYFPDYLRHIPEYYTQTDPQGHVNTYYTYLKTLVDHHTLPVVIAEFGVPSGRGMAQRDANTHRNQGNMDEQAQGRALAQCWQNIKDAGCAGAIVFSWQDEWFKRTWNTMANVDLLKTPYWSDYQTNEQYFGLLAFDPGADRSVSYVDGDDEEWNEGDVVGSQDGEQLSMKYDEKFVYLMVRGADTGEDRPLYIPIDTTQKSGSRQCESPALSFDRDADFLLVIDGEDNSRLLVQERYEVLRATSLNAITGEDPYVEVPAKASPVFKPIRLLLQALEDYTDLEAAINGAQDPSTGNSYRYQAYETGKLAHGDANPDHADYNSLADFCFGDGFVEVRIPWQLLNFSNPSEMQIHDDYYEHYGVENMAIDSMALGVGTGRETIRLFDVPLKGWGSAVTYHERLKPSYYIMKQLWADGVDPQELWDVEDSEDAGDAGIAEPAARAEIESLPYEGPMDDAADDPSRGEG